MLCGIPFPKNRRALVAHEYAGARRTPHLEKLPNGVLLENLLCRRAAQMPCAPEPIISERILELAKGFEPLTL